MIAIETRVSRMGKICQHLILFGLFLAMAACAARSPTSSMIVMRPGSLQGLFEQCVAFYHSHGLSIAQAVNLCRSAGSFDVIGQPALNPHDIAGPDASGVADVACGSFATDPRRSGLVRGRTGDLMGGQAAGGVPNRAWAGLLWAHWALVEQLRAEANALGVQAAQETDPQKKQQLMEEKKKADALFRAAYEIVIFWDAFARAAQELKEEQAKRTEPPPTGDFPTPAPDRPAPAHPGPEGVSACEKIAAFIAECATNEWKSGGCRKFQDRMNECADPTISYPNPESEQTCGVPKVSSDDVKRVTFVVCSEKIHTVPGEEPCKPLAIEGEALRYWLIGAPGVPACEDPRAMADPDQPCGRTITLVRAPRADLQAMILDAHEKLGGPLYILPTNPPAPRPGGPDPFPGIGRIP